MASEPGGTPSHGARFVGGAIAGSSAAIATYPLDLLRTRVMVGSPHMGVVSTFGKAFAASSLYSGLSPTLVGLTVTWSIYFSAYDGAKGYVKRTFPWLSPDAVHMGSAVAAGILTDVVAAPIWVIKVRMQTQGMDGRSLAYPSITSSFRSILANEGIKGLYKGLLPTLLGVSHVAIQFPVYERLKEWLRKDDGGGKALPLEAHKVMLASAFSKVLASTATFPHERLRVYAQDNRGAPLTLRSLVSKIWVEEGVLGFYRGMGVNLLRVVPSCVISFTIYELFIHYVGVWDDDLIPIIDAVVDE